MQTGTTALRLRRFAIGLAAGLVFSWLGPLRSANATVRHVPNEYPTIQAAIDHSASGDTVLLNPGVYRGTGNHDIELRGRDVVVLSREGPDRTIIDCQNAGRGFYVHEGETLAARIEGITIEHGFAPSNPIPYGGAIRCDLASPSIVGCKLLVNNATDGAGAIDLLVSNAAIDHCVIAANNGGGNGGGILWEFGQPRITSCVITGNWAGRGGGVAFGSGGPFALTECTIAGNFASDGGGIWGGPFDLDRCIVWANCAFVHGDQVYGYDVNLHCCDVDTTGFSQFVYGVQFEQCVFTDPLFCEQALCGQTLQGNWAPNGDSPCLPERSPCGQLIGALDQGCGLPPPTGACCDPSNGACTMTTQADCQSPNVWQGPNTACTPNYCPPPSGACCHPPLGGCSLTTQADCQAPNTWMGPGASCNPNPCTLTSSVAVALRNRALNNILAVPNPSSAGALILYQLPKAAVVTVEVFSASGSVVRRLAEGAQSAGARVTRWDGRNDAGERLPAGIYFARIHTPAGIILGRIVLAD